MQLAHTLLIFYMDDSIDKGTPSIRRFVKMEMAKRGVEMVEIAKVEVAKEDGVVVPVEDKSVAGANDGNGTSPDVKAVNADLNAVNSANAVNSDMNAVNSDMNAVNADTNAVNANTNALNANTNAMNNEANTNPPVNATDLETNKDVDTNERAILPSPNLFSVS